MADSYNELFGLSSEHSTPDSNLELHVIGQETSGTDVTDRSPNDFTITWQRAITTRTGPGGAGGYLPTVLNGLNASSSRGSAGDVLDVAGAITLGAWVLNDGFNTKTEGLICKYETDGRGRSFFLAHNSSEVANFTVYNTSESGFGSGNTAQAPLSSWYHLTGVYVPSTEVSIYEDATLLSSNTTSIPSAIKQSTSPFQLGCLRSTDNALAHDGGYGDFFYFSRELTTAEIGETKDGPEVENTVAPAVTGTEEVGETLTTTDGTWALPSPFASVSNGTPSYSYQWTRSNDAAGTGEADISGATSSTYVLVAGDSGKFIRCRVRGTNLGGFDSAQDTDSNMTGAIGGGGGGGFQPAWASQRSRLYGAGYVS